MNGKEHFFERKLTKFADKLFFQDKLNLFELYHGLLTAHQKNKDLNLEQVIKNVELKYPDVVANYQQYLEIDRTVAEKQVEPVHV